MKTFLSVAAVALLACATLPAQRVEIAPLGAWTRPTAAPLGSLDFENPQDDDTRLRSGHGYGVRATLNTPGYYGHEIGYIYNRVRLETRVRPDGEPEILREDRIAVHQAFYNFLIYFMPAGERWRPFITGGLQAHQYGAPNIPEWDQGRSRNYGVNYGGGLKLMLFRHALVRFDLRDYITGRPWDLEFEEQTGRFGGRIRQLEASVGLAITF